MELHVVGVKMDDDEVGRSMYRASGGGRCSGRASRWGGEAEKAGGGF